MTLSYSGSSKDGVPTFTAEITLPVLLTNPKTDGRVCRKLFL